MEEREKRKENVLTMVSYTCERHYCETAPFYLDGGILSCKRQEILGIYQSCFRHIGVLFKLWLAENYPGLEF